MIFIFFILCGPNISSCLTRSVQLIFPSLVQHHISKLQLKIYKFTCIYLSAGPSGRAVKSVGLQPLVCWDCGFENHRGHGRLSVVNVVCCQYRSLRRTDHASRGVLPNVVRSCVWSRNLNNEEAMARLGPQRHSHTHTHTHTHTKCIYIYIFILHMSPKTKVWLQLHPIRSFSVQTFQIYLVHILSATCSCFARLFWLLHIVHGTTFIVFLKFVFKIVPGYCTYVMSSNEEPRVPSDFNIPGFVCG